MDRRTGEGREINSSLNPQQQQVVSADQNDYDVYSLSTTLGDSTAALDEYYRYVSCFFTDHAHQQQELPLVDCYHHHHQQQQQQLPSNNNDYNISSEVTDHEPAGSSGSSLNISSDLAVAFRNNNCSSEPVPADGSAIAGTSVSSASSDEDLSEKFTEGGGNDVVGDEGEEKSTTVNSTSTNTTTTTNNKGKKKAAQKRVRQQRFAFVTKSDVDHLEDGYRWRKYGQKAVKNSPYPRSYYRCTNSKCTVKKRVERSSEDPAFVITTYEGQHCHHNIGFPRGIASAGYNNMINYENAAAAAALMSSRSSYPQFVPLQSYANNYHIRMQQHQQQQFPSSSSLLEASAPAAGNNNKNPATTTATMSSSSSLLLHHHDQQQQRIRSRSNRSESNINAAGSNTALTNSGLGLQLQTGEEVYHHQHQHHLSQMDEGLLGDIVSPRSRML